MRTSSWIVLTLSLIACGAAEPGDAEIDFEYGTKCNVACDISQEDECDASDKQHCIEACGARTEGLSILCATCITSYTYIWGYDESAEYGQAGCEWTIGALYDCESECEDG